MFLEKVVNGRSAFASNADSRKQPLNAPSIPGAELSFVVACCRWPDDDARHALVADRARKVSDWEGVRQLASAHRVEGFVADAVRRFHLGAPGAIADWADDMRTAMRAQATLEIAQTLKVCEALTGIPLMVLKGAPLGVEAYGRTAVKRSWDIDILVDPADAIEAAQRIAALGYAPSKPPRLLDKEELRRWSSVSKHAGFRSSNGMEVELHWRLTSLPGMLEGVGVGGPVRTVTLFGDREVPTFAEDANLAFLCVHGTSHGWSRLKWLADFSALASAMGPDALERAVAGAKQLGTGEAIGASFKLRERLFGVPVPSFVGSSEKASEIADLAISVIVARNSRIEIEQDRAASASIERIRRLMGHGRFYIPRYLVRRHRGSEIRALVALPAWLDWAYWLIRPYSVLRRLALRRLGA
jgi:hypothetical protein